MKLELGGGHTPKGDGFINLDKLGCGDVSIDFETDKFPYENDSVSEVYTAHCLEHVNNAAGMMREILRVCRVGAHVEIRVPHWLHPMSSCIGHVHVISDRQMKLWVDHPEYHVWASGKRFEFESPIHYQIDVDFYTLRNKFPQLTDEEVAKFIPGCCHEIRCKLKVVAEPDPPKGHGLW